MSTTLNLDAIQIDGGTQCRAALSDETVAEYAEEVRAGGTLPPVTVFFDGSTHWLADGFHRFHAHRSAGETTITADVRTGTQRDAILFAAGANATHGLRRTNADKRKAVEVLLADPEWSQWSDREIGRRCEVRSSLATAPLLSGPGPKNSVVGHDRIPTLAEVGISKDLSSRAQKLAAVPEAQFEAEVSEWRERVAAEGARVSARLIEALQRYATTLPEAV